MSGKMEVVKTSFTKKMLGDAGEHFALAMLMFHGFPCSKMADNWPVYDLIVENKNVLQKVSVKTRSKQARSYSLNSWFGIDRDTTADWLICVLMGDEKTIQAWVVPISVALATAKKTVKNDEQKTLHIPVRTLLSDKFRKFEANWNLLN